MAIRNTTEVDLFELIRGGHMDAELDGLAQAVQARRRFLHDMKGAANQAALTPGTKVRITGGIKPKYLVGVTGTVSAGTPRRRGDIKVTIDSWCYTGRYGKVIDIPASCLEGVA